MFHICVLVFIFGSINTLSFSVIFFTINHSKKAMKVAALEKPCHVEKIHVQLLILALFTIAKY